MLERDDETPDPYPKPGPNMKNRLMIPFERILKQFEELPEPIKNNHTGFSIEKFRAKNFEPKMLRSHSYCEITILRKFFKTTLEQW